MQVTVSGDGPQIITLTYDNGDLICQRADMTSYQWGYDDAVTLDSTLLSGETNQNCYQPGANFSNRYYWVITTYGDCQQKTYVNEPLAIHEPNKEPVGQIILNPNPSTGSVKMRLPYAGKVQVSITDMAGRVVGTTIAANGDTLCLDLASGLYLLTAAWEGGKATGKVVIAR
jgi:hypothetical protein